jgi:hypothetical protein
VLWTKVISGGQTGVDRAALDAAMELGLPCGGWCPKGRLAEDGAIPSCYPLQETPSEEPAQRTEWNVRDSDGTLVLIRRTEADSLPSDGTPLTIEIAHRLNKPCLILDLDEMPDRTVIFDWARRHHIRVLNVAGPRESLRPGTYALAKQFLSALLNT